MRRFVGASIGLTLAAAPVALARTALAQAPPTAPEPLPALRHRVGGRPNGSAACRRGVSKP